MILSLALLNFPKGTLFNRACPKCQGRRRMKVISLAVIGTRPYLTAALGEASTPLSIFEAKAAVAIKHPPPASAALFEMFGEGSGGGLGKSVSGFAWTAERW